MKAIKHIKAGELHIEVIGQIPDRKKRSRAARGRPTSPAQVFYNHKCSWRELELNIAASFTRKDWVVTFTYTNECLPSSKKEAKADFQKYIRRLKAARKKRGQDLMYVYTTEGFHGKQAADFLDGDGELEDVRLHHHVVLNGCGPEDWDEIKSLWHGGGYVRIERYDPRYVGELARYMTKEAREFGRPKPGERVWCASRNIKKYEVTYEEIRSDSVTLAPPPGAEDCTSFSEVNPYGYGAVVGIRYFLRASRPLEEYSYNKGRKKE